jgi:lipopolysaccharide export system protein LptA
MTARALAAAVLVALIPGLAAGQLSGPLGGKGKDDKAQPLTVDADRMERFGKENLVVFSGNVVARRDNSVQYADRVEVYLDEKGDRVLRTVSTGSVRIITKDCRTGTAQRAEYFDLEQRVMLIGNARVWEEDNVVSGDTITLFISQDRSIVQGGKQERVKAVFHPRDEDKRDGQAASRRSAEPCKN